MTDTTYLIGSEDVKQASQTIYNAADLMMDAARNIEATFSNHERFLENYLIRLSELLEKIDVYKSR